MQKVQHLTLSQAARLLGVSTRQVGKLREMGFIETDGPGRYPLISVIRGAINYYEIKADDALHQAQGNAATRARTRETELRIKRKMDDLIEVHIPGEVMDEFGAMVAEEMRKIPSNVYPNDPENHAKISAMIEKSLARMEKQTAAAKARLANGDIK